MLIPEEVLKGAMSLNVKDIRAALNRNGYTDEGQGLREVQFVGMSANEETKFVYNILYLDSDDDVQNGNIYIEIKQHSPGNFAYYADF
jgi:hypothetical protein